MFVAIAIDSEVTTPTTAICMYPATCALCIALCGHAHARYLAKNHDVCEWICVRMCVSVSCVIHMSELYSDLCA